MTLSHLIGLTSWEQGCGQAFLGDSLRSPRPSDLLACQLASRREDHSQVSIIMSVLLDAIRPCNDLDTIVANGRKQTVLHLFLDAALKTVAYLRVSTRSQDLANQKLTILEFSQKRRFPIDRFIESRISSRQSPLERRIEELLAALEPGDRLLVSELSRLGRSLSQVIQIVDTLVHRKIRFIAIKEAIEFDGK